MMAPLVLGVLALIAMLFLGQLFVGANPRTLAKALRIGGAGVLAAAALALLTVDRVGIAMLLGSMAWGLYTGGRVWPGGWPHYGPGRSRGGAGPGPAAGAGQATKVRTDWLELQLDHATGAMRGTVLRGRFEGQALERMGEAALVALYREAAPADAETARLLETFIDRVHGTAWRTRRPGGSNGNGAEAGAQQQRRSGSRRRARANGGMSPDEAYAVLGLEAGASADEIRAAHRKLMMQNHPDRGGSDYLAAKINEAKDVLLAG